ncbi:MAG TPA: hypothetical protein VE547_06625 [Mycobacteriales bacterium]|jgi:ABC-2 type transport system permease protein|nr:hypothetical protein [Mycobacteriales bacterium]
MRPALHAEWTKLRTVPGPAWSLAALVAATVGLGALVAGTTDCGRDGCDPVATRLAGVYLGQLAALAIGVVAVSGEYDTMLVRTTLAAEPRRGRVFAAKAVVATTVVLGAALLAVVGSLLATGGVAGSALRPATGTALYLGLVALLGLGLGAVVRHTAAALTTAAAVLYLPLLVTLLVPMSAPAQQRVQRWAPMTAGLAVQSTVDRAVPIGPWTGLGVLAGYAAAGSALGYAALRFRDA